MSTGVAVQAQRVDLDSAAPKGALIGGMAGYASAKGKSSSKRARNTLIGSAVGGSIAGGAQGSRMGMAYTVELAAGSSMQVVTDQTEIRVGDCVSVEQAGSGSVNLRRASPALCQADDAPLEADLVAEITQDAQACITARDQLLAAEDDAAIDRAALKVQILCND
ncbi:MAG: hypothetical protein V2I63_08100 [Pseudomonadales bacterium]|nr:hypothetical protein [Pseudomonadales bacterium]